jgi:LysM domain
MYFIILFLMSNTIILSQTKTPAPTGTVPGTFPPVPNKYWVTTKRSPSITKKYIGSKRVVEKSKKSNSGGDDNISSESGIIKWVGGKSYHYVMKHDTLWGISRKFFQDPYYWPKLWSINPHITNPHWVFPGTIVWLAKPLSKLAGNISTSSFTGLVWDTNLKIRNRAYIEEKDVKNSGTIMGSPEEKSLLSVGDDIYVKLGKKKLKKGETYIIYRPMKVVKNPKKKSKKFGRIVKIIGDLKITGHRPKGVYKAMITRSVYSIKRGDLVYKIKNKFVNIKAIPVKTKKSIIGKIVSTVENKNMLSTNDIVMINLGAKHKIFKGAVFRIVSKKDGITKKTYYFNKKPKRKYFFPYESIGSMIVIYRGQNYSLAFINKCKKVIKVGDNVVFGVYPEETEKVKKVKLSNDDLEVK